MTNLTGPITYRRHDAMGALIGEVVFEPVQATPEGIQAVIDCWFRAHPATDEQRRAAAEGDERLARYEAAQRAAKTKRGRK